MAKEEIIVLALVKIKEGIEESAKQKLMALVAPTRNEAGCISYDLHQNKDDKSRFMFYENWVSKEALDEHLKTPHLQAFINEAESLLAEPLDVTIWEKLS